MAPYVLFFLLQLGFEEISTYVIYGTGAFFAGWILSAVVSALDSIPLVSSYQVLRKHTIFCMIEVLVTDCDHVCSSQKFWKSWALGTPFGSAHGVSFSRYASTRL